jgi:hypothetical protein
MALRASIWLVIGWSFRLAALAAVQRGAHAIASKVPNVILPGAAPFVAGSLR